MRLADTNILIYAVSNRVADAPKRTRAIAILKEPDLALSVQVLQEFYYQATRLQGPAGLTHEQAMAFIRSLRTLPTQDITPELFDRATEIKQRFGLSYWDAAILAAAKMLGCDAVYSEDLSHNVDYYGLRVINPLSD
ncbi:MAG: PIN domain-containing protein [Rhodothermaceae bacterium]|nr:PIN domain-containing protein [Rhodothermaceae bacterium]